MTDHHALPRDGPVGCGWLTSKKPQRCCTNPATWIVKTAIREIGLCDGHYLLGVRWANPGGRYTVIIRRLDPDEPTTLF